MSKRAILFPGQGAQAVGMGRAWYETDPEAKALFDRASELLGFDLAQVCIEGPNEALTASDKAQPAIFVVSAAGWLALRRQGVDFDVAAGLSSGEWAALYAAGVLEFDDIVRALEARGRLMQQACEASEGGMLSLIGMDLADIEPLAAACGVEVANLNSPAQTVLSGPLEGITRAEAAAKEAGAKRAIPLPVAGAFHSSLMAPAAEAFREVVEALPFQSPSMPVLSNVTGEPHADAASIKDRMVEQITGSVQWVRNCAWMEAHGVTTYVECGPGKVLTGLVKRMQRDAVLHAVQEPADLEALS